MFTKTKKIGVGKPKSDPQMFYSKVDIYYNSYLTELLDTHSLRVLHFILIKANNTKTWLRITYAEIRVQADLSCHNYVQKALKQLIEIGLIETSTVKKQLRVKLRKTARKMKT